MCTGCRSHLSTFGDEYLSGGRSGDVADRGRIALGLRIKIKQENNQFLRLLYMVIDTEENNKVTVAVSTNNNFRSNEFSANCINNM